MEQARVLANILKEHPTLKSLCGNSGEETELDMSGKKIGAEGAIMLAPEIAGNGAISSVNLLKNQIPVEQAQELVTIMQSKAELVTLCGLRKDEIELDFSRQGLGAGDAVLIANDISDMGALFSVDVGGYDIPADKLQEIDQAVRSNRLKPIHEVGNKSLSEIDLSSRYLDAKDAIVVAEYIKDNGALTSLNLASNDLKAEGVKIVAEAIKVTDCAITVILVPFSCPSDHWLKLLLFAAIHRIFMPIR
jgi:hypothetical protein